MAAQIIQSLFRSAHHFTIANVSFNVTGGDYNHCSNYGIPISSFQPENDMSLGIEPEASVVELGLMETLGQEGDCLSELSGLALDINKNIREIEGDVGVIRV